MTRSTKSVSKFLRERFHRDESGAILLLMLAAVMILMMMAWVLFDSIDSATTKADVQAAADTAAWSQTSVEARTMNMVTFSNVGKRVTVGMASAYQSIVFSSGVVLLGGAAICVFSAGTACTLAGKAMVSVGKMLGQEAKDIYLFNKDFIQQLVGIITKKAKEMVGNMTSGGGLIGDIVGGAVGAVADIAIDAIGSKVADKMTKKFEELTGVTLAGGSVLTQYFAEDVRALDNYQSYMIAITPWWGWSEGLLRGVQNGATATTSFPAPDTLAGNVVDNYGLVDLTGVAGQSGLEDALPLEKAQNTWGDICKPATNFLPDLEVSFDEGTIRRIMQGNLSDFNLERVPDMFVHMLDFGVKSGIENARLDDLAVLGIMGLMGGALLSKGTCLMFMESEHVFWDAGMPYKIKHYDNPADWLLNTSNLTFAYRADKERMSDDGKRKKYGVIDQDYLVDQEVFGAGGYWALSRAEISYQGHDDELGDWKWNPKWTTRMRPIAFTGEWSGVSVSGDHTLKKAWRDVLPMIGVASLVVDAVDLQLDQIGLESADIDRKRIEAATEAMDDQLIEGVPR